ncbi:MAG: UDP-N-acetylmuramoyl-L-alanyl-D-glutamate--2,6-diaminopimelate ligase [Candidatus Spechtbacterales bacterium]
MKELIKKFIPPSVLEAYHSAWPALGAFLYGHPSKEIKVIGITGTNGKTSVAHLCSYLLENAGYKTASISSLRFKIGNEEWPNKLKMTMPGRMKLHLFLRKAADAGCQFAVIEVTSEGVRQNRHKFIEFDTAVFTNLTPEHIESHGSFENYKNAKGKFFSLRHRASVVNLDDENANYFLQFPAIEKIGYTLNPGSASLGTEEILAEKLKLEDRGINFYIRDNKFSIPILGKFNAYNVLAAIGAGRAQGIPMDKMADILSSFPGVPGRAEVVIGEPFNVVVDYAHTPDALEKVYNTVSEQLRQKKGGRTICVLGAAGGGRDKWKRPKLGEIASEHCDEIILTDEDPYTENPESILKDIESGLSEDTRYLSAPSPPAGRTGLRQADKKQEINYEKILDRRQAIREALKKAKEGDNVIITGKGAEPLMMTAKGPVPWDDRQVAREEFSKLYL